MFIVIEINFKMFIEVIESQLKRGNRDVSHPDFPKICFTLNWNPSRSNIRYQHKVEQIEETSGRDAFQFPSDVGTSNILFNIKRNVSLEKDAFKEKQKAMHSHLFPRSSTCEHYFQETCPGMRVECLYIWLSALISG